MEPLQTDEERGPQHNRKADFESQLMGGCVVIVVCSLVTYGLGCWPALVVRDEYTRTGLFTEMGLGMLPALIFGIVSIRKAREAGLAGFLGGAMAFGVFLYLRLMQVFVAESTPDLPQPEWPKAWTIAIPAVWALVCIGASVLSYPFKQEGS
ncbi:MAG: hypothetical protein ABUL49_00650 [bacterium]